MPARPNAAASASPAPASPDEALAHVRALSYEDASRALEQIIDRIESGEIGLEQSLLEYERGLMLRDHCREILARSEQRVQELTPPDQTRGKPGDSEGR